MSRIRQIKPGFFKDADLYDAEVSSGLPLRVAFSGLWTVSDKRGIFAWSRNIKPDVLPYDPCDMLAVLDALAAAGFVQKYEVDGKAYGIIPSFGEHQHFHRDERASTMPAPAEYPASTVSAPDSHGASTTTARREAGNGERGTGNGERGTGNGERAEDPPPTRGKRAGSPKHYGPKADLSPFAAAYLERFPGSEYPGARFGKVFKGIVEKHGPTESLRRWVVFLAAKGALGAEYFARTWSEWGAPPVEARSRGPFVSPTEEAERRHKAQVALADRYAAEARLVGARWAKQHPAEFEPIREQVERSYRSVPELYAKEGIKAELTQRCAREAGFPSFDAWCSQLPPQAGAA